MHLVELIFLGSAERPTPVQAIDRPSNYVFGFWHWLELVCYRQSAGQKAIKLANVALDKTDKSTWDTSRFYSDYWFWPCVLLAKWGQKRTIIKQLYIYVLIYTHITHAHTRTCERPRPRDPVVRWFKGRKLFDHPLATRWFRSLPKHLARIIH